MAATANNESLQVRVQKVHSPKDRSSQHLSTHKGAKNGVCPNLEDSCVIAKALSSCVQGPCETGETVDLF